MALVVGNDLNSSTTLNTIHAIQFDLIPHQAQLE